MDAALPFFGALLAGGFDDFQLVGREPSALGAFGLWALDVEYDHRVDIEAEAIVR